MKITYARFRRKQQSSNHFNFESLNLLNEISVSFSFFITLLQIFLNNIYKEKAIFKPSYGYLINNYRKLLLNKSIIFTLNNSINKLN